METSGIKYIGSKNSLLEPILSVVNRYVPLVPGRKPLLLDAFTGTTRVAQAFRQKGWNTVTSDLSWASEVYAKTFLQTNSNKELEPLIEKLNKIKPKSGWITQNYCDVLSEDGTVVRVWQPKNGMKADAIRDEIERLYKTNKINDIEKSTLVTALIFALDKVDNTVGIQQAYLKNWCVRSHKDLVLVLPKVVPVKSNPTSKHIVGDCLTIAYDQCDVAYLDPPYSSHTYFSYYHIWDSIVRWDKPEVSLKTNRRIDRVTASDDYDDSMSSPWNSKTHALNAFESLIKRLPARYILTSYSNESLVPINDLIELCRKFGPVHVEEIDYKRNIMSQLISKETVDMNETKEYLILLKKR
jgi:adenine-specific DNA-methyltransferase